MEKEIDGVNVKGEKDEQKRKRQRGEVKDDSVLNPPVAADTGTVSQKDVENDDQCQMPENAQEDVPLLEQVFGNHLILSEIFKYMTVPELLTLSLISKFWKSNARTVLRESKRCLIKIGNVNPCIDLEKFHEEVLPHIDEMPFNGLSIITLLHYENEHDCITRFDKKAFSTSLLNRMDIKYLKIGWDDDTFCPVTQVIEKLVKESSSKLEGLHIKFLTPGIKRLSNYFFETDFNINKPLIWFPRLRTLEIPLEFTEDNDSFPIFKELMCIAPNVKHLFGGIQPTFLEYISLCDKVNSVREFHFQPGNKKFYGNQDDQPNLELENREVQRDLNATLNFAKEGPKLRTLRLTTKYMERKIQADPLGAFETISEIYKLLFTSCCDSLESLHICHLDLILLQRVGIPSMKSVRKLFIDYNRLVDKQEGYNCLQRINFPHLFPNVETVVLYGKLINEDSDFYITDEFRNSNIIYSCPTVTKLDIESYVLVDPNIKSDPDYSHNDRPIEGMEAIKSVYAKLFPNVKDFSYFSCKHLKVLCGYLWTTWMDLEKVTFVGVDQFEVTEDNFDAVITGIPPDYWNYKDNTVDYEHCQIGSSIRDLKKLKTLRFEIKHESMCFPVPSPKPDPPVPPFISEAAAAYTLSQMPGLTVEIFRVVCNVLVDWNCRFLSHLNPFVKFSEPEQPIQDYSGYDDSNSSIDDENFDDFDDDSSSSSDSDINFLLPSSSNSSSSSSIILDSPSVASTASDSDDDNFFLL